MYNLLLETIQSFMVSVIMTYVSRQIPTTISYEVFLSYLGLGLGRNTASLGRLISDYTPYMNAYPHLFWTPVLIMASISVSLYIVGQRFADAADPRTHM